MKKYDFKKAIQIIEENKDSIQAASLGMHEDWFWTAEPIFGDGEFTKQFEDDSVIGGINSSNWATPTLELEFKDGSSKMISCFVGESDREKPEWFAFGVLSQPIQDNITPLED